MVDRRGARAWLETKPEVGDVFRTEAGIDKLVMSEVQYEQKAVLMSGAMGGDVFAPSTTNVLVEHLPDTATFVGHVEKLPIQLPR